MYKTRNPEETYQACNKKEHLPRSDLSFGKVTLCEYYTYDKEDSEFQQLKELQAGDIIYKFYFSQDSLTKNLLIL